MKKLMFVAAMALTASAFADSIQSSIVGYTTITINKEYAILAVNFQGVGGDAMAISNAIPVTAAMTQGTSNANADNIQVMQNDGTYKIYYVSNGKAGKKTYDTVGKWVCTDDKTVSTGDSIKSGTAFWYQSQNYTTPYTITVAGQVLATTSDTKEISQTYMLVASPYPAEIPLNDCVVVTEGATQGSSNTNGDNLQIMQDDGTYKIYYLSNGKAGKKTYDTVGKWVCTDDKTVATTDTFPVGKGAWFMSQSGSSKIKFVSPLAE